MWNRLFQNILQIWCKFYLQCNPIEVLVEFVLQHVISWNDEDQWGSRTSTVCLLIPSWSQRGSLVVLGHMGGPVCLQIVLVVTYLSSESVKVVSRSLILLLEVKVKEVTMLDWGPPVKYLPCQSKYFQSSLLGGGWLGACIEGGKGTYRRREGDIEGGTRGGLIFSCVGRTSVPWGCSLF